MNNNINNNIDNNINNNITNQNIQSNNYSAQNNMQPQNNNIGQQNSFSPQKSKNNKTLLIVGGAVIGAVILLAIIRTLLGTSNNTNYNTNAYEKNEKILNENFQQKDYVLPTKELLIEVKNNSNIAGVANIKVEFYDKNQKLVDVKDTIISGINKKKTNYTTISLRDIEYDTYKVTTKMKPLSYAKLYDNDITIVSDTKKDSEILIQYQNKASVSLDYVDFGVFFYDSNNKIIGYSSQTETDVPVKDTFSTKAYIPYDDNFKTISYSTYEVVVLNAVKYENLEK